MKFQNELADFRVKYNLVDPVSESLELKERLTGLEMQLAKTKIEALEYSDFKEKIKRGDLSIISFAEFIPTSINNNAGGVEISKSDAGFFEKTLELETELAEARLSYLPNSKEFLIWKIN